MSCYAGPIETPNIDRIAAGGIQYTQWHTTALSPTRSCLRTGRNHTRNSGEPVTCDCPGDHPHHFTAGTIKRVAVDVSGDPHIDMEREAQAMLTRE
jgi:arylsulfatase A-like enzyme